ncbi:NFACT RNA binding domain-containing protein [Anaeromyxobacter oryzisoli]|uniref:NFACT RNA binding domain-containing protein n=1 Tax=Anaeromyxobacter oryzisoli TaxID=2925408 RepID=UPI001F5AC190|nr:NFACT RNA binding domain-containing protein [Anaeromyxobacter sp. SG63]
MSLTAREIALVVEELAPLCGARVDQVRVHAERALTLELFGAAGEARLLLSAEPNLTRLHVSARRPPAPEVAFQLQALLRKELEGARLAGIDVLPGDRVIALRFERAAGPVRLVAELTGRHGNLFLVAADGTIRASAGRNPSERRRLVPGQPYVPPVLPAAPPGETPSRGATAQGELRFTPVAGAAFPLSAAIDAEYRAREEERLLVEGRRRLREPVRAAIARAGRALVKLADEEARVPAAEGDRRAADLLKTNLRLVRRGAREVEVTEWTEEGPRQVKVALDPALAPQANMERYYRRYRRIVESAARVAARAVEVRGREAALRALLAAIDAADLAGLPRLEKEARRLGAGPRRALAARRHRRSEPALPYRTFRSLAGLAILVGKGAAENDQLTVRVAKGSDVWLHARGQKGAHVVVRVEKGKAPDGDTLLDAAHLAAHFSDARGAPQVEVAYTRAKYVRKPKGAAPGAVTYTQERVLALRVEPARIERLLSEEEGEG